MSNRFFPVSFAQQRLLFLDQLDPAVSAYNLTRAIRMVGPLDPGALRRTLNKIVQRHASLRTKFVLEAENAYQIVSDGVELQLPIIDISHLPNAVRDLEAQRLAREEGRKIFNLSSGPLFRAILVRLGPAVHVLVLVMHHIITDGWSMSILFDEIGQIYTELTHARPTRLSPLSIQYADFARWQREHFTAETLHRHVTYWTHKLRGHRGFLELPTDRSRPTVQSHEGAIEIFKIGEQLTTALARLAKAHNATLFMVLLSAFQTLLWRYTGSDDVLIGTPIAGRNDPHFEKLIGLFVNTLVIRGDLAGNPPFRELLCRTRKTTLEAYDHQDLPFEQLVQLLKPERSLRFTPLFQVMFVLQNAPKQVLDLPGLHLEEYEFDSGSSKFDLTLEVVEQDGLYCTLEYSTALFDKQTIKRLAGHFETLLGDLAKSGPERPISDLNILDEAARNDLIFNFNSTSSDYRRTARLDQLFEEQVQCTPDRVALIESDSQITYRDLNAKANALAALLVKEGCNQARPVGVYMQRSIDAVVVLLAALKANTPYVPLDTSNPSQRLKLMIGDADCTLILTHRGLGSALPGNVKTMSLDDLVLMGSSPDQSAGNRSSEDLAYIIYTSGSTGAPKGVQGSHRAAVNRFEWMWRTYPFTAAETCCQKTALGFVDSVWEIFGPLLGGVRAVIAPDEYLLDLNRFVALLAQHEVTRLVLVPSLLGTLLDLIPDLAARLPKLALWSISGEVLSADLVRRFRQVLPTATLLNIYGSSEVAADVTYCQLSLSEGASIPIGRPISNTQIFILDQYKSLVPPLVHGEIHVGGDCLARGYWKRPELTSQRFIPNPYRPDQSPFVFATGDLARMLSDGTIEYVGRKDQQIKLRGMRIELGEIEENLKAHPLVHDSVVAVHGDSPEGQRLIAYIVRAEGSESLTDKLGSFLKGRVPEYMVPTVFIELQSMPLLPSGKIDRNALPSPSPSSLAKRRTIVHGRSEIEQRLTSIWQEVLRLDDISINDNFFDLGGHSLGGLRVLARVRRDFHVDVPIRALFEGPTIADLALEIEKSKAQGATVQTIATHSPGSSVLLDILQAELGSLSPDQMDAILQSILAKKNARAGDEN
jgi:amino acid adenylation domain-containing protein